MSTWLLCVLFNRRCGSYPSKPCWPPLVGAVSSAVLDFELRRNCQKIAAFLFLWPGLGHLSNSARLVAEKLSGLLIWIVGCCWWDSPWLWWCKVVCLCSVQLMWLYIHFLDCCCHSREKQVLQRFGNQVRCKTARESKCQKNLLSNIELFENVASCWWVS